MIPASHSSGLGDMGAVQNGLQQRVADGAAAIFQDQQPLGKPASGCWHL